jgi:glycosyltransferase involved in cell wall biosynthesis
MSKPRVTVLMCVFNGREFLSEAVESILVQTMPDFELLVIDDGSTDGSGELASAYRDPRIRVLRNDSNVGLTRSLNRGLELAQADLIARQDADDISYPDRLMRQVTFLEEHPSVALVGTQSSQVDVNGRRSRLRGWPKSTGKLGIRWQLMFDNPFIHTSVMFRRSVVWEQLGGYQETFRTNQDFELWSRVAARHEVRNLPDMLVVLRMRPRSVSRMYRADDLARVLKVFIENRRRWLRSDDLVNAGLNAWMSINSSATVNTADLHGLVLADVEIFRRFAVLYPDALTDPEIRTHRAVSLARAACDGVRQGAKRSRATFLHACRIRPSMLVKWGPRFVGSMFLRRRNELKPGFSSIAQ